MVYVSSSPPWTEQKKKEIIERLQQRGVRAVCPMCGTRNFTLLDGFFMNSVQPELSGNIVLGGPAIPSIAIACTNCGFISHHAAGVLGLLPGGQAGGR